MQNFVKNRHFSKNRHFCQKNKISTIEIVKHFYYLDYSAFRSFNMEPLVKMGVQININWDAIWRSNKPNKFSISQGWNQNVALLRLFPSITATTVRSFLQPPIRDRVVKLRIVKN